MDRDLFVEQCIQWNRRHPNAGAAYDAAFNPSPRSTITMPNSSMAPRGRTARDQANGTIDPDTLAQFVSMCLSRLQGEARTNFLGKLAQIVSAQEHNNSGNGGGLPSLDTNAYVGPSFSQDRCRRAANDRRLAHDAAPKGGGFLSRFPEARHIQLGDYSSDYRRYR
jgi:hypothetical protein